jgi:hydroxypyruvate reductase
MVGRISQKPSGRIVIVGAGKAAASMAHEVVRAWGDDLEGLVIVPYGHALGCGDIEVIEAAHPVPDASGVAAARRMLELVSGLRETDTVVCLVSGGGSSLLTLPAPWLTLHEKQHITSQLLGSGATIREINCVRKKLSAIKGGKLAAACAPARVLTWLISDVPGNDPAVVASGPTIADAAPASMALDILDTYKIGVPDAVRRGLLNWKPADGPADSDVAILACADDALAAAAEAARAEGLRPIILGDLAGDARELAREHAALARQPAGNSPCVVLSGGETTIRVSGAGRGGRNGEYALALALELQSRPGIFALAADTDGIDGTGDNAGCFVTPDTLQRARDLSVDPTDMQRKNDSYAFFAALDDLVITGPTLTNVNDFRALLFT